MSQPLRFGWLITLIFNAITAAQCTSAGEPDAWKLLSSDASVKLRSETKKTEGEREFIRFAFDTSTDFRNADLMSEQPPALAIEDFRASMAINSNQLGIRLALRLILPNQMDPRNNRPFSTLLVGESYEKAETWQTLTVSGSKEAIEGKLREIRAELKNPTVNAQGAYFDACILLVELHRGSTFVDASDVNYGPIVEPPDVLKPEQNQIMSSDRIRAKIDREQLFIGKTPVLLRFLPDHGETPALLSEIGVNGVWISDIHAQDRMTELLKNKLLVLATPPHPKFDPGDFSAPIEGLLPLDQVLPAPSMWYLGTSIASDQLAHLLGWAREVRSADRNLRRPIVADVIGATDIASRQVDCVGLSRHRIGGRLPFGKVRNLSFIRQNATAQLAFPWEWIQTEAADDLQAWRTRSGSTPLHVEPEQIIMQLVACLSAGSRGIGYWKTQSLESKGPTSEELRRAIAMANIYAGIIESHLVQGRIDGHIPVLTARSKTRPGDALQPSAVKYTDTPTEPDAAIITNGATSLILAGFWDAESQFVPQELHAAEAAMTVAASETASAWQITATGVKGLRRQPTAGGLYLQIKDFDQLGMIFVSSDPRSRKLIEDRVYKHAGEAAKLLTELAELKLERVRNTCAQVEQHTAADPSVTTLFRQATEASQSSRDALGRGAFAAAEKAARTSMRLTRKIQNRYWYRAIKSLPSPTASPHTISFSTLPDHWKLMNRIATAERSENLVPSGSFDSLRLLSAGKWKTAAPQEEKYFAKADVKGDGARMALRMRAAPRSREQKRDIRQPSLLLSAPEIHAKKGEIFEITGRVRIGYSVPSDLDRPFMIFDSDLGPETAVSPVLEPTWRTFRLYREASVTGPLKFWMALQGAAEVFVDDFSVVRCSHQTASPPIPQIGLKRGAQGRSNELGSRVQGAGYSNPTIP